MGGKIAACFPVIFHKAVLELAKCLQPPVRRAMRIPDNVNMAQCMPRKHSPHRTHPTTSLAALGGVDSSDQGFFSPVFIGRFPV